MVVVLVAVVVAVVSVGADSECWWCAVVIVSVGGM